MTEAKGEKHGYFAIYKRGQGKWTRWGTVAAMAIVVLGGTWWWVMIQFPSAEEMSERIISGVIWTALGAFLTYWLVNSPKMAEFLIMTESEMRKVSWPSRREVVTSTKVVILLTVLLGLLLFAVDVGFYDFFIWIGLS